MYKRLYTAAEDGSLKTLLGGDEKGMEQLIQEM
jgi:hypothetical protein